MRVQKVDGGATKDDLPRTTGTWKQVEVGKGVANGHGTRWHKLACNADTSGGGWRVAGWGKFQLEDVTFR